MYWAPGAAHGPHHVFTEWADKYKGKFDDGWDAYRERVFKRQKELGWIPADTELTPRPDSLASWDSVPESQRDFQRRLMEVFAGFVEHTDAQVGKLVDGLEELGVRDNTIILYIWGDNGASAEGQRGSISELLAQNNIPNTVEQQMKVLDLLGGLEVLGSAKTDNMYHASWAWAGDTPLRSTKLVAAHFGGTRNPLVVSWPKGIKPDKTPRSQFHHVNDVVPTLYDIIGIQQPQKVDGFDQDPIDGVSMAYSFANANADGHKKTQYFENNASRGVYHDGWFACTFGPFLPWDTPSTGERLKAWNPAKETWELYDLTKDFSQANDLSDEEPQRLAEMKKLFLAEAKANKALPIGGGLWTRFHPEDLITSPYKSWKFDATTRRMPEFTAPGLGKKSNVVTVRVEVDENASGVLYALGGGSGGLTLFMDQGKLVYEYNMLLIERYSSTKLTKPLPSRRTRRLRSLRPWSDPGAPATVVINVDGEGGGSVLTSKGLFRLPSPPAKHSTWALTLAPRSHVDYTKRRPFEFNGVIKELTVTLE